MGNEIENPFGGDDNDLPLDEFCIEIAGEIDHSFPTKVGIPAKLLPLPVNKSNVDMLVNTSIEKMNLSSSSGNLTFHRKSKFRRKLFDVAKSLFSFPPSCSSDVEYFIQKHPTTWNSSIDVLHKTNSYSTNSFSNVDATVDLPVVFNVYDPTTWEWMPLDENFRRKQVLLSQ